MNMQNGVNNDLIDPFQITVSCWWAKQRAMRKRKKKNQHQQQSNQSEMEHCIVYL